MAGQNPQNARNIIRILQKVRNWLLSHDEMKLSHRYEDFNIVKRTQPPPSIPPGPAFKLSDNYYYTRDGRRESLPPTQVYNASQSLIGAGEEQAMKRPVLPGNQYNWQTGKPDTGKK